MERAEIIANRQPLIVTDRPFLYLPRSVVDHWHAPSKQPQGAFRPSQFHLSGDLREL